jgi:hypothetical protein
MDLNLGFRNTRPLFGTFSHGPVNSLLLGNVADDTPSGIQTGATENSVMPWYRRTDVLGSQRDVAVILASRVMGFG